jgi:hypothetical protein
LDPVDLTDVVDASEETENFLQKSDVAYVGTSEYEKTMTIATKIATPLRTRQPSDSLCALPDIVVSGLSVVRMEHERQARASTEGARHIAWHLGYAARVNVKARLVPPR